MQIKQALQAVSAGEGEAWWWFGVLAEVKATAATTDGQFTVIEVTVAPGYEGVRHVHHNEDEAFWILEGDVTLEIGDEVIEAHAGDYAFGPRDIPHSFSVRESGARMLFIFTPGGFEELVRATGVPAASRTLPPPPDGPPDFESLKKIVARYGAEILM
ncbi:MAG: quercetin 2,3-dioxygenase [Actinomycetota bacterium]|nr:quercetin 2,3-dioxygenase [Actinomycetota bacterium]